MSLKTCPGYGLDLPHELEVSEENFHQRANGRFNKWPRCKVHQAMHFAAHNAKRRPREGKGVYLAALKLPDRAYLAKPGKAGDGEGGFQSRAGTLAKDARRTEGLDVVNAEILLVIDIPDADARTVAENHLKAMAEPIHGTEYFRGIDFPMFARIFEAVGRPYTARRTYTKRNAEFRAWLARELDA